MKRLSLIVPCYNEEEAIPLFYEACLAALGSFVRETAAATRRLGLITVVGLCRTARILNTCGTLWRSSSKTRR